MRRAREREGSSPRGRAGRVARGTFQEEKKARKQELRIKEDRMYSAANILMKNDAEYRSKRRIFWVLMAIGVVAIFLVRSAHWVCLARFPRT